jgi:hypothetical protein
MTHDTVDRWLSTPDVDDLLAMRPEEFQAYARAGLAVLMRLDDDDEDAFNE